MGQIYIQGTSVTLNAASHLNIIYKNDCTEMRRAG